MVAFTTATNSYSEQKLREEKHQPLSAKVWNSEIQAVAVECHMFVVLYGFAHVLPQTDDT